MKADRITKRFYLLIKCCFIIYCFNQYPKTLQIQLKNLQYNNCIKLQEKNPEAKGIDCNKFLNSNRKPFQLVINRLLGEMKQVYSNFQKYASTISKEGTEIDKKKKETMTNQDIENNGSLNVKQMQSSSLLESEEDVNRVIDENESFLNLISNKRNENNEKNANKINESNFNKFKETEELTINTNDGIESNSKNLKNLSGQHHRYDYFDPNINFEKLVDPAYQEAITRDFHERITSKELMNDIKEQYKIYKDPKYRELMGDLSEFNTKERELALQDKIAMEEGTKLHDAIINFVKNNVGEYKQDGLLTAVGGVAKNIPQYVHKEAELSKQFFEENPNSTKLNIEDLDKLIHFDKVIKD